MRTLIVIALLLVLTSPAEAQLFGGGGFRAQGSIDIGGGGFGGGFFRRHRSPRIILLPLYIDRPVFFSQPWGGGWGGSPWAGQQFSNWQFSGGGWSGGGWPGGGGFTTLPGNFTSAYGGGGFGGGFGGFQRAY